MFFDEEMLLELRLNTLNKFVDKFVIVESSYTHSGKDKKLIFDINKYSKFKDKIHYIVLKDPPYGIEETNRNDDEGEVSRKEILNALKRENLQRDTILDGLKDADKNDWVIISDLDEIPNLENLNFSNIKNKIIFFSIYCGLIICFVGCTSIMGFETNSQTDRNNVLQADENHTVVEVKILIECTLSSIKKNAFESLYFPIKNKNSTLKISNNGTFSGSAIRNSFFGEYTKSGKNINFRNISSTLVNCIDCDNIESLITSKLGEVNNYVIENNQLLLKKDKELLMTYRINR